VAPIAPTIISKASLVFPAGEDVLDQLKNRFSPPTPEGGVFSPSLPGRAGVGLPPSGLGG